MITAMCRSLLSKLVSGPEIGKCFVVAGILETCVGIGSPPLFGLIYTATLTTMPSVVYFLNSGLGTLIIFIFM